MKYKVTILSIGSGDPELLNLKTIRALKSGSLFLRTGHHPLTSWLEQEKIFFQTLDSFYETAEDFDQLNLSIAAFLLDQAARTPVIYAVPDATTDHTVQCLLDQCEDPDQITVIPGISAYDQYLADVLSAVSDTPVTVTAASDLIRCGCYDPNQNFLITELDHPVQAGQLKLLLSQTLDDEHRIILLPGHQKSRSIFLFELDRQHPIDHRTALLIPGTTFQHRQRYAFHDLINITELLRSPQGNALYREQTHQSLRHCLTEDALECAASIDRKDMDCLCEKLGDLLFQIVFHSSIGQSFDEFTLNDVISGICVKLISRLCTP